MLEIHNFKDTNFAKLVSENIVIKTIQNVVDMAQNSKFLGANIVITRREQYADEFYDLSGESLIKVEEKAISIGVKIAVIGDFKDLYEKGLKEFISNSNKKGFLFFFDSMHEAKHNLIR